MITHSPLLNHSGERWRDLLRGDLLSRSLIRHLGGLSSGLALDWAQVHGVLDVGCGSGAWARAVARTSPHLDVLGIDCDPLALDMAGSCSVAGEEPVPNVRFAMMDAHALDERTLPSAHFDLVHLAFLAEALLTVNYAALVRSLFRVTRAGGMLLWTEAEFPLTTSPACERLFALTLQAIDHAGHSFLLSGWSMSWAGLPENRTHRAQLGITPMIGMWLRETGYENQRQVVAALEVSHGQPLYSQFVNAALAFGAHIQPFLVRQGVIDEAACERLREEVYRELRSPEFCGMAYVLTVSARKSAVADCSSCQTDVSSSQQEGRR